MKAFITLLLILSLSWTSYSQNGCEITGNQNTNVGIGVPIDQSGWCYVGQTFIAQSYLLYNVQVLLDSSGWYVQIRETSDYNKIIGTSSTGTNQGYNVFITVYFNPPIPTIPGKEYVIVPKGPGTWYINNNNLFGNGRMVGTNPGGSCWATNWDGAFNVNCFPPSPAPAPTDWKCYPGIDCPMRYNGNGQVECMANDGANCFWNSNCAGTLTSGPANNVIKPLQCGLGHMNQWGALGYDQSIHWCSKVWEMTKPWLAINGLTCPMRISPRGNPECLSMDGRNCLWGSISASLATGTVYDASSISPIQPLECGKGHIAAWGDPGYENPAHWCLTVLQAFESTCINGWGTSNPTVVFCSGSDCGGARPCPLLNS